MRSPWSSTSLKIAGKIKRDLGSARRGERGRRRRRRRLSRLLWKRRRNLKLSKNRNKKGRKHRGGRISTK